MPTLVEEPLDNITLYYRAAVIREAASEVGLLARDEA